MMFDGNMPILNTSAFPTMTVASTVRTPGAFPHNVWVTDDDRIAVTADENQGGCLTVWDVSNKAAPITLSSTPYIGSRYTHQGWLTDDQRYFLVNDELDETNNGHNARTYVFDVADLDAPVLVGYHQHTLSVIDHNLYVHDGHVFESNYEAGLRILRLGNLSQAEMTEVAYFDVWPSSNSAAFNGNWNNFMGPLIYLNTPAKYPVILGLYTFAGSLSQEAPKWNYMMAMTVIMSLPILLLYFRAQKYFIEGLTVGGVKG